MDGYSSGLELGLTCIIRYQRRKRETKRQTLAHTRRESDPAQYRIDSEPCRRIIEWLYLATIVVFGSWAVLA
jgi:hypothetical protein